MTFPWGLCTNKYPVSSQVSPAPQAIHGRLLPQAPESTSQSLELVSSDQTVLLDAQFSHQKASPPNPISRGRSHVTSHRIPAKGQMQF